jgi:Fur family transcriptional regulator, ferric uptake regulator
MPKISLGTVYRNLEILSQEGMIQKLEMGGSQKRFDGNAANHYHIRCQQCGRVDDLALHPSQELEAEAERLSDWTVMRHRLEFVGLCPACREKAAK